MSQIFRGETGTALANIETLTGNSGGSVGPDGAGNTDLLGVGVVTVTGDPVTFTLEIEVGPDGLDFTEVTGVSQNMAVNHCYEANNAALVTLTLPATAAVGDVIEIIGYGAGLWSISQNANQVVHFGAASSTVGLAGSVSAQQRYDCIKLRCAVTNLEWVVCSSSGAGFTIV